MISWRLVRWRSHPRSAREAISRSCCTLAAGAVTEPSLRLWRERMVPSPADVQCLAGLVLEVREAGGLHIEALDVDVLEVRILLRPARRTHDRFGLDARVISVLMLAGLCDPRADLVVHKHAGLEPTIAGEFLAQGGPDQVGEFGLRRLRNTDGAGLLVDREAEPILERPVDPFAAVVLGFLVIKNLELDLNLLGRILELAIGLFDVDDLEVGLLAREWLESDCSVSHALHLLLALFALPELHGSLACASLVFLYSTTLRTRMWDKVGRGGKTAMRPPPGGRTPKKRPSPNPTARPLSRACG